MLVVSESLRAKPQGVFRIDGGKTCFRVWAPRHQCVTLLLDDRALDMISEGDGYFSLELPDITSGMRYAYRLGTDPLELPDPASRWQLDGVHRRSAVFFPNEFTWQDADWKGLSRTDLVIYELHVGTFTPDGTFAAIIPRLAQLKDLGVTALELMPVAQFPGSRNWGYDGVHPYAAQNSYGGPQGLMQLVDAAHRAGLGVLLDVVYNHLGPEGNYLAKFGPYFHDRYHTPWGPAVNYDGPDSDPVRRFVIDNACQWIRDFHLDGLRLDAVQTIFDQSAYPLLAELQVDVKETAAACGRSAIVIAETDQNDAKLTADVDRGGFGLDGVWSDDFHHCVHVLLTNERDGYYADFKSPAQQLVKAYREAFVYDGVYSPLVRRRHGSRVVGQPRERFVICVQNHDQVGNRPRGDRLAMLVSPAAQRLAAALMLIAPDTPLLFMGEEYGETNPFPFFCSFGDSHLMEAVRNGRRREFAEQAFQWQGEIPDATVAATFESARLSWKWENDPHRSGLRRLYQTLLAARRTWPPLVARGACEATLVNDSLIVIERGCREPEALARIADRSSLASASSSLTSNPADVKRSPPLPAPLPRCGGKGTRLIAVANLSGDVVKLPSIPISDHAPILSTAERRFGGERGDLNSVTTLAAHELVIWGDVRWT